MGISDRLGQTIADVGIRIGESLVMIQKTLEEIRDKMEPEVVEVETSEHVRKIIRQEERNNSRSAIIKRDKKIKRLEQEIENLKAVVEDREEALKYKGDPTEPF